MEITVILGGDLRKEAIPGSQERLVSLDDAASIEDLVQALGLRLERIGMVLHNGQASGIESGLKEGDRVGLFPPELRYNTFVSLYFRTGPRGEAGGPSK